MSGSIRCPSCGGLNPAGAEWCGQCLTRFEARTPPPPPPPPSSPAGPGLTPVPPGTQRPAEATTRGPFTVGEAGITWRCTQCDTENPLDAQLCSVCGTRFADIVRAPDERPYRDPNTAALYSLFFPGTGHWWLGLKGQAVARGVLSTWVVLVALLGAIGGATVLAGVFALVAFALWGLAAHDAYREARREPAMVMLKGRAFLYLVLGLLMMMVVLLVAAGLRVGAQ